jgi:hypothetical protein
VEPGGQNEDSDHDGGKDERHLYKKTGLAELRGQL